MTNEELLARLETLPDDEVRAIGRAKLQEDEELRAGHRTAVAVALMALTAAVADEDKTVESWLHDVQACTAELGEAVEALATYRRDDPVWAGLPEWLWDFAYFAPA